MQHALRLQSPSSPQSTFTDVDGLATSTAVQHLDTPTTAADVDTVATTEGGLLGLETTTGLDEVEGPETTTGRERCMSLLGTDSKRMQNFLGTC